MPKIIEVSLPFHEPGKTPDHVAVGKQLDALIKQHFMGKKVVVRLIGSQDHPGLSLDDLVDKIVTSGTDRYEPQRMGIGYEEFVGKKIQVDFYGEPVTVTNDLEFMGQAIWEMHHSAIGDRGYGVHVNVVLLYDADAVEMVMNMYDYQPNSDGYVFKNQTNKPGALLGIIKINS